MKNDIIGAAVAAVLGVGIAFVNYLFSKQVLLKSPDKYSFTTVIRQLVQVGYLVLCYFIGERAGLNPAYPLVAAVFGMTVPMLFFTKKLLGVNNAVKTKEKGEEEKTDG